MESLLAFFTQYGLPLTGIAILGIIILGILKYCNVFSKLEENVRHYIYLAISFGLSVVGAFVYLLITNNFNIEYFLAVAGAMWLLNQTFYNIFKVTSLNDLVKKILERIAEALKKNAE